jgi:small subunit ribosomal protein S3
VVGRHDQEEYAEIVVGLDGDGEAVVDGRTQALRAEIEEDYAELRTASADEAEEIRREINETLRSIERDVQRERLEAAATREAFMTEAEERMTSASTVLDRIDAELTSAAVAAREEWNEKVADLREDATDLRQKMNELQAETADDFDDARDALADEIAEFTSQVRAEARTLNVRVGA